MPNKADVDETVSNWKQGDVLEAIQLPFLHIAEANLPLTRISAEVAKSLEKGQTPQFLSVADRSMNRHMIVSQTCDVVRPHQFRPYVELAPLVTLEEEQLPNVLGGKVPRYYSNNTLAEHQLAVDLDRIMTVEKAILVYAKRWPCCEQPNDLSMLQQALARKRARFAFPDDFVDLMPAIRKRVVAKHNKETQEGEFLRATREIRVLPKPSWDAENVELTFFFIFGAENQCTDEMKTEASELCSRFIPSTKYSAPVPVVISLTKMSAASYLQSAQMDFEFLSEPREGNLSPATEATPAPESD